MQISCMDDLNHVIVHTSRFTHSEIEVQDSFH